MLRLRFDTFYLCAKFEDSNSNPSIDNTPLLRVMLGPNIAYLCTKFDQYSFSRSRDMVGAHRNLNGLRDLTTLLSRMI